ncbi:Cytochrome P450 [Macrophomina phaseolina MS6]|uniref:Cytochrome P450 n=1 Tax=Macrophomina phaseolina (strain MS6) TaxID=1126212 RepID=K2SHM8_MACPH|nr:Cytochrome P450 [Macrophomina phaseolina MS6]
MTLSGLVAAVSKHQLVLGVLSFLFALIILHSLLRATLSSLRSVPGPFLARFSRLWYLRNVYRGDFHTKNVALHRQYGPIVRIAPGYFSIDDPSAVRTIYGIGTHFTKGPWYDAGRNPTNPLRDIFTDRDSKRHAANRRKVASLYSMTTLLKMEEAVNDCIDIFETRFRELAGTQQTINLQYWLQCYAFDVIGSITLAKRFGFLDEGKDPIAMLPALHRYLMWQTHVGIYAEWHAPLYRLMKLLRGNSDIAGVIAFSLRQIAARREANGDVEKRVDGDDFLAKVLRLHEEEPRAFTMSDVISTCAMNIGAGSDTTSIALSGIMWGLVNNPEAFAKLRAEIDEKRAKGEISSPVTFAESQNMPYLQAVIREGLRIHPSTGLPMQRVVPKGGAQIAGKFFSEGTMVGINSWVAHANKEVFGDDADHFRPERWLADKETVQRMDKYWLPFGHGSRTCIGKNISLMEIGKLIPHMVEKFDFHLSDAKAELVSRNVWFVKQNNFMVRVTERRN